MTDHDVQTSVLDFVALVYAELGSLYGDRFTLEHGREPSAMWRAALAGLTVAQLERGLGAFHNRPADPPNLTQFLHVCRGGEPGRYARLLAHPPPSTRERALERIRRRLEAGTERP